MCMIFLYTSVNEKNKCIFSNFGINPFNMQFGKKAILNFVDCKWYNNIKLAIFCHDLYSVHLKVLNGSEKIFEITKFVIWDSGVIYGRGASLNLYFQRAVLGRLTLSLTAKGWFGLLMYRANRARRHYLYLPTDRLGRYWWCFHVCQIIMIKLKHAILKCCI